MWLYSCILSSSDYTWSSEIVYINIIIHFMWLRSIHKPPNNIPFYPFIKLALFNAQHWFCLGSIITHIYFSETFQNLYFSCQVLEERQKVFLVILKAETGSLARKFQWVWWDLIIIILRVKTKWPVRLQASSSKGNI